MVKSDAEKRPLKLSLSAGSYVCNDLFYRIRYTFKDLMAGFIHVPKEETLALYEQIKTIEWVIQHLEA